MCIGRETGLGTGKRHSDEYKITLEEASHGALIVKLQAIHISRVIHPYGVRSLCPHAKQPWTLRVNLNSLHTIFFRFENSVRVPIV